MAGVSWQDIGAGPLNAALGNMGVATSQFEALGFEVFPDVFGDVECVDIASELTRCKGVGSRRMLEHSWCREIADRLMTQRALVSLMPQDAVPVLCTYFSKSPYGNWLVAPHQDLSIPVAARVDAPECSGWSEKEGLLFTQPPTAVLQQLLALRVHVDACGANSGPLVVAPGSHRMGRLTRMPATNHQCLVPRGGVLALRPLLVRASSKAAAPVVRRVLHFVFGPAALPHGLQWSHVA